MKNLFYKELKLVISPSVYLFALFSALIMIPKYPFYLSTFYFLMGIYTTLKEADVNKDHEFTVMLPIPRNHVVKAKYLSVVYIEMIQILFTIPFAIISSTLLNTQGNPIGIDTNFAFFGFIFTAMGVFNAIFLPMYFKSGYKIGIPMTIGVVGFFVASVLLESIVFIMPQVQAAIDSLNPATFFYQGITLLVGIAFYVFSLLLSYRISIKNFASVNL